MDPVKQLLPQVDQYFKANLHTHTNISDGNLTPEETKQAYKGRGYSILCLTDHNIIADHSDLNDPDFLLLTGAEYNIDQPGGWPQRYWTKTYHLNFIAKRPDNLWQPFVPGAPKESSRHYLEHVTDSGFPKVYDIDNINAMIAEANRRGFLVMYNHPTWSLQSYADYSGLKGLWGMEIANHDCFRQGYGDRDNSRVYTDLVNLGGRVFPLGTDDTHHSVDVGGAWIMVGAKALEYGAVIDALEKGDFYASTGPEIYGLSLEAGKLRVRCSDARCITLESGTRFAKRALPQSPDTLLQEAEFDISRWLESCAGESPLEWLQVKVQGPCGDYAATRAFWYDEFQ